MKYQAPKCCGRTLQAHADVSLVTRVTMDGKPAMRSPKVLGYSVRYLFCMICKSTYSSSLDNNSRILKGEKIDS